MGIALDIVGGITSPFLEISLQLVIAFWVLIWFTLSLIYALLQLVSVLLGQPFVGWILTGQMSNNSLKDLNINSMVFLHSPFFAMFIIALSLSIIFWLIYFLISLGRNFNGENDFRLRAKIKNVILLISLLIWVPLMYSIFAIIVNGLLMLISGTGGKSSINNAGFIRNIPGINQQLSQLSNDVSNVKSLDPSSEEYKTFLAGLNPYQKEMWSNFINIYDKAFNTNNLTVNNINELQNALNNFYNGTTLTKEQMSIIPTAQQWSSYLSLLHNFEYQMALSNTQQIAFNGLISTNNTNLISSMNANVNGTNIYSLATNQYNLLFLSNPNITTLNDNFNITNYLYQIALSNPSAVFQPGWDPGSAGFTNNFVPPISIITPILNVTVFLPQNIQILATGMIANFIVVGGVISFVIVLLERTVYILLWPFLALFALAKSGEDNGTTFNTIIKELFFKFFEIIFLSFFWNLMILIVVQIYQALLNSKFYASIPSWEQTIFSLVILVGVMIATLKLIKTFLALLSSNQNYGQTSHQLSSVTSNMLNRPGRSLERAGRRFGGGVGRGIRRFGGRRNGGE